MVLTRAEKEALVKRLFEEGKTIREIAKEAHMSFTDISAIIRKVTGGSSKNNSVKPTKSIEVRALGLFSKGKTPVEVAIKLDISSEEAETFFIRYWRLKQQYDFELKYKEMKNQLPSFLQLYGVIKSASVTEKEVVILIRCAREIPQLRTTNQNLKNENTGLEHQKGSLLSDVYYLQNLEVIYNIMKLS
jgi:DNA-binding CsgD family transcriptional regulator